MSDVRRSSDLREDGTLVRRASVALRRTRRRPPSLLRTRLPLALLRSRVKQVAGVGRKGAGRRAARARQQHNDLPGMDTPRDTCFAFSTLSLTPPVCADTASPAARPPAPWPRRCMQA
eukprot:355191-Chlamydomonas_euryale.AAC.5